MRCGMDWVLEPKSNQIQQLNPSYLMVPGQDRCLRYHESPNKSADMNPNHKQVRNKWLVGPICVGRPVGRLIWVEKFRVVLMGHPHAVVVRHNGQEASVNRATDDSPYMTNSQTWPVRLQGSCSVNCNSFQGPNKERPPLEHTSSFRYYMWCSWDVQLNFELSQMWSKHGALSTCSCCSPAKCIPYLWPPG